MTLAVQLALVIVAITLALIVKGKNPELSYVISIGLCLVIMGISVSRLQVVVEMVNRIAGYVEMDASYLTILLKMIGISYICEFASGICKDAGYTAVASQIELVGKLTLLALGLPVVLKVIERIVALLGG
jgi:stage III sporulation protein AD